VIRQNSGGPPCEVPGLLPRFPATLSPCEVQPRGGHQYIRTPFVAEAEFQGWSEPQCTSGGSGGQGLRDGSRGRLDYAARLSYRWMTSDFFHCFQDRDRRTQKKRSSFWSFGRRWPRCRTASCRRRVEILESQFRAEPQGDQNQREEAHNNRDHGREVSGPEARKVNPVNATGVLAKNRIIPEVRGSTQLGSRVGFSGTTPLQLDAENA
jgi:hypothetical protein